MRHRVILGLTGLGLALGAVGYSLIMPTGTAFAQEEADSAQEPQPDSETSEVTTMIDNQPSESPAMTRSEEIAELGAEFFIEELRRREEELNRRQLALDNERAALTTVLDDIEERTSELEAVREEITLLLNRVDRERHERVITLADWYAPMDPTLASEHLSTQPVDIIVEVLQTMTERSASAVLESFDTQIAQLVIDEMVRRR